MADLKYAKAEKISLKSSHDYNEKWVQDRIFEDPKILGLGNLLPWQKEKILIGGGRLDLLLQDLNEETRYEVEIQLGSTNESHIIRVLEYWDLEKKRNPNFNHVAVLIAEDITSRFLNVIRLFNGVIPLMALQLECIKVEDRISLFFTKVLDQRSLSIFESEEPSEPTDRAYWEKRGTIKTVGYADDLLKIVNTLDSDLELKYNKFYIGLAHDGQPFNFITFKPQKNVIRLELKLSETEETNEKIEAANLEILQYSSRNGRYLIRLSGEDLKNNLDLLTELITQSYNEFGNDSTD